MRNLATLCFASLLALGSTANATERREHGAHAHGHAELRAILDEGALAIEIEAPGADIVGFEHLPKSDADKAKVAAARATLLDAERMFRLPAAAGCALDDATAAYETLEEAGHAAFHAAYQWTCAAPGKLDAVVVRYFEHFPATEELDAEIVGPSGQSARELTATENRFRF